MPPIKCSNPEDGRRQRISKILEWKSNMRRLQTVPNWTFLSLLMFFLLWLDAKCGSIAAWKLISVCCNSVSVLVKLKELLPQNWVFDQSVVYLEYGAMCIVGVNTVAQIVLMIVAYLPLFNMEVNENEQELCAISADLPGFNVKSKLPVDSSSSFTSGKRHNFVSSKTYSPKNLDWLFKIKTSPSLNRMANEGSYGRSFTSYSPGNVSYSTNASTGAYTSSNLSYNSSLATPSSPWSPYEDGNIGTSPVDHHQSYGSFYDASDMSPEYSSPFTVSPHYTTFTRQRTPGPSARSPKMTPKDILNRYRRARSCLPQLTGDISHSGYIEDANELRDYLNSFHEEKLNVSFGNWNRGDSFNTSGAANDLSLISGKKYQMAVPSPPQRSGNEQRRSKTRERSLTPGLKSDSWIFMKPSSGGSTEKSTKPTGSSRTWILQSDKLDLCSQHIRTWLSGTIFRPMVKKIDKINAKLSAHGHSLIGATNLANLSQLAVQHPDLKSMLPYLDLGQNQDYIVSRLKELALDGCLGVYRWNRGGSWNGRDWSEHLPTDAALVFHMFCTYMNSALPLNPLHPQGEAFTGHYFIPQQGDPSSPFQRGSGVVELGNGSKVSLTGPPISIYQESIRPPHFQLLLRNTTDGRTGNALTDVAVEVLDIEKGQDNLFYTLILFLKYFQDNLNGHIDSVSLGASALNVGWIFS